MSSIPKTEETTSWIIKTGKEKNVKLCGISKDPEDVLTERIGALPQNKYDALYASVLSASRSEEVKKMASGLTTRKSPRRSEEILYHANPELLDPQRNPIGATPEELAVRKEYLEKLAQITSQGCTACEKGRLFRQYLIKLGSTHLHDY